MNELDLSSLSINHIIVTVFYQNHSIHYKEALSYAQSASFYKDIDKINIAGFSKTREQISLFMLLVPFIYKWQGTKFYAGGRALPQFYPFDKTLNCYLLSLSCLNYKAFCQSVEHHPFSDIYKGSSLVINPCKNLNLKKMSPYHPATVEELLQAMAVEENIDWCPNFDPSSFQIIIAPTSRQE